MQICTTRFGNIEFHPDAVIFFEAGVIGFEDCQHWVLLDDPDNPAVGWLQNVHRPELAMAVVSPRRFVPEYRVRIAPEQLQTLQLGTSDQAFVLSIVGRNDHALTINLRAPLLINLQRRIGRQLITLDRQPLQYEIVDLERTHRRAA